MSLDVRLIDPTATYKIEDLYSANITHNLGAMADRAGIYNALWRPYRLLANYNISRGNSEEEYKFEEFNIVKAKNIINIVEIGVVKLKANPDQFRVLDSPNEWGIYDHFIPFVEEYLKACNKYPEAIIKVSR